jgi:hypothetical protein
MTIPAEAKATPLPKPDALAQFIEPSTGSLTSHGLQLLAKFRDYVNGGNRVIPCSASTDSNVVTLTPNDATPFLEKYIDHEIFVFVADATSTGAVTMTVVPKTGTLETLKAYVNTTQANTGDVVINRLYLAIYNSAADAGAGGFILK